MKCAPKKRDTPSVTVATSMPREMRDRLQSLSRDSKGVGVSYIVRRALTHYIDSGRMDDDFSSLTKKGN